MINTVLQGDCLELMKQLPDKPVENILGKGKAKLYLENKVTLSDLVRADGSEVTLRELREKFS